MDMKHQRKGQSVITILLCSACKHTEKETLDLDEPKNVPDPNYQKDSEMFCLDEKRGQEYLACRSNLEHCTELMKEIDEREKHKELYDKVAKIKKVGFGEIQKN